MGGNDFPEHAGCKREYDPGSGGYQFYNIADYVDDVGIGQHGYCYIADDAGNIVYHPQQQLIYASLKEENQKNMENGTYIKSNVIYTVNSLQNCDWHIIGSMLCG